jgi:predicted peptidase
VFSGAKQAEEPAPNMQVAINILLNVLDNHPVDRKRVYLTGLSMGGYGSWDLAARHPEWFAAVVPICGGGDSASVARLVKLPVWAIHGDADPVVPVSRTRQMIEALREAGGKPHYSELPDVGHNSWTPGYDDPQGALPWMFQQVNAQAKQPRGS